MAKGLDELIEYLLVEIAHDGFAGASVSQLTDYVKSFYENDHPPDQAHDSLTSSPSSTSPAQTVDDAFIARVWKWLGRHPDISIGKHGKSDDIPLHQFQSPGENGDQNRRSRAPKLYASEELIYQSICGHPLKGSRLPRLEYVLLAEIAAARTNGILQGDLGRRTGQDKRSVPKRTDALQAKGYIIKQPFVVKGTQTSLLFLRRYAPGGRLSHASSGKQGLLVRHVIQRLSDRLAGGVLLELEKLLSVMDDESDIAKRALSKIIRPLEKAGCFKRARMASGPAAHLGNLKTYVQQIRSPAEEDLSTFEKASIPLDRSISEWLNEERTNSSPKPPPDEPETPQSCQLLTRWNPDRLIVNQRLQAVSNSAVEGLDNGPQAKSTSLRALIQTVKPIDVILSSDEPGIIINDDGIEIVRRPVGEPAREEASPEVEERATQPHRRKQTKRRMLHSDEDEKPRGRPRKFVRGTEKFWQYQFWQAKLLAADVEGATPTKEGVMEDPAGIELFECRPDLFDETLVNARAAGLPVPSAPDEINDNWVRQTQAVLERSDDGAYITPIGMYVGRTRCRSQLLFVRSRRLNSVDWHDRTKIPKFRFITSSVAHSLHCRRYYPQMAKPPHRTRRAPKKTRTLDPPEEESKEDSRIVTGRSAPQLGLFVEPLQTAKTFDPSTTETPLRQLPIQSLSEYQQYMDTTESESDSNQTRRQSKIKTPSRLINRNLMDRSPVAKRQNGLHFTKSLSISSVKNARDQPEYSPRQRRGSSVASQTSRLPEPVIRERRNSAATVRISALEHLENSQWRAEDSSRDQEPSVRANRLQDLDNAQQKSQGGQPTVNMVSEDAANEDQARKRSLSIADSDDFNLQSPVMRRKRVPREGGALCQRIIFELVTLADGVAPNDRSTIQRYMTSRWQAGGGQDRPLMKPIKAATNSLVTSGKLKEHFFTFRGKGGATIKKSILHLPEIDAESNQVNEIKKLIVDADAIEYIPPQWLVDTLNSGKVTNSRRRRTLTADRELVQPLPTPDDSPRPEDERHLNDDNLLAKSVHGGARPQRTPKRGKIRDDSIASTRATTFSPEPLQNSPATGFLTLKIPSLHTLQQVQDFNSKLQEPAWKTTLSVSMGKASSSSAPDGDRKRRPKRQRNKPARYDENAQDVIWAPPEKVIPESLEHLLNIEAIKGHDIETMEAKDPESAFSREVDFVAAWEEREAAFLQSETASWNFINHSSSEDSCEVPSVHAWYLINFNTNLKEQQLECTDFPSYELFIEAQRPKRTQKKQKLDKQLTKSRDSIGNSASGRRVTREATGAVKKRKWMINDDDFETSPQHKRVKRAGTAARSDLAQDADQTYEEEPPSFPSRVQKRAVRLQPKARPILRGEDLQFAIAVTCIRTLTGGIEKVVDWDLVLKVLPERDIIARKRQWESILRRCSYEVNQLSDKFQEFYLDALEKGEAPTVDFDNLEDTDWHGLVSWTASRLSTTKLHEGKNRIASSRDRLVQNEDIHVDEALGPEDMFGHNISMTHLTREETCSSVLGGRKLSRSSYQESVQEGTVSELELQDASFAATRSGVLAIIQTSEATFESQLAEEKLVALAETVEDSGAVVRKVLSALQRDQLIEKRPLDQIEHKGLRQWQLSDTFDEALVSRRLVQKSMLKTAAAYKMKTLDTAFARGEKITIARDANLDDGVMVAILNLVSQEQIEIRHGTDVPNSRYGIDWEKVGYQTKLIDKSKIAFSTILKPTSAYTFGDPVTKSRSKAVPRGDADPAKRQIPLWIDINGNLLVEKWEVILAAVVGLTSVRPGIDAREVARMVNWTLTAWEVDLVLQWSQTWGFVRQTQSGKGWDATGWWWMAVGSGISWN